MLEEINAFPLHEEPLCSGAKSRFGPVPPICGEVPDMTKIEFALN